MRGVWRAERRREAGPGASKRIKVEVEDFPFGVPHGLMEKGESYVAELSAARAAGKQTGGQAEKRRNKIQGQCLREIQPW